MGTVPRPQQVAPLLWTPWYASGAAEQNGILWFWPNIQDVCQLPDPKLLPPLKRAWDPSEVELTRRYMSVVDRLVATTVFRGEGRVRINVIGGTVEKALPADEVTLGFAALLRQLFHHTEEASFDAIRRIISRGAHQSDAVEAVDTLRLWKDAHGTLLRQDVHSLLDTMARARGLETTAGASVGARPFVSEQITPRDLIDTFLYGDHLHYGKGRDLLEHWRSDNAEAALMEVNMLADSLMLAHFYAGFAEVVRLALASAHHHPQV